MYTSKRLFSALFRKRLKLRDFVLDPKRKDYINTILALLQNFNFVVLGVIK